MDLSVPSWIAEINLAEALGLGVPVAAALFGVFQWVMSERRRQRARDVELVRWANDAIRCFAQVEDLCAYWAPGSDSKAARALAVEASALVDQGRLFFPNVRRSAGRQEDGAIRAGKRPAILDELLRVFSVARLAAREPDVDIRRFQDVLWAGRVRFVSSLQLEMGKALRETPSDRQGADFDPDPRNW